MHTCTTSAVIEALVTADSHDLRRQHVLRQALHGLVRQAKSEQMLEVRKHAARLTGVSEADWRRLASRGRRCQCDLRQQQFEFDRQDKSA
ncbi:hypothetical protein [Massilia sp. TS11]|uniref:hypothetical protein n=1 Tax=Massilia sp. TS11 TaxID=2908003 RepID=UPI001EDB3935|nr:hypothetical protein [Massilia sp. TS11]MCG2585733.1 hypothetical protein [Massilia sp. TS11]